MCDCLPLIVAFAGVTVVRRLHFQRESRRTHAANRVGHGHIRLACHRTDDRGAHAIKLLLALSVETVGKHETLGLALIAAMWACVVIVLLLRSLCGSCLGHLATLFYLSNNIFFACPTTRPCFWKKIFTLRAVDHPKKKSIRSKK